MDPLDTLEMIFRGMQSQKRVRLERGQEKKGMPYSGHNPLILKGLQCEIDMLGVVLGVIEAVKEDHPSARDEMVLKMYGT